MYSMGKHYDQCFNRRQKGQPVGPADRAFPSVKSIVECPRTMTIERSDGTVELQKVLDSKWSRQYNEKDWAVKLGDRVYLRDQPYEGGDCDVIEPKGIMGVLGNYSNNTSFVEDANLNSTALRDLNEAEEKNKELKRENAALQKVAADINKEKNRELAAMKREMAEMRQLIQSMQWCYYYFIKN